MVIKVGGETYALEPQPIRSSLSDSEPMLWGFQVHVRRNEVLVGVKTCFVGRVGVQVRDPAALEGPIDRLVPVLHELALARIRDRIQAGETGDEIVFA